MPVFASTRVVLARPVSISSQTFRDLIAKARCAEKQAAEQQETRDAPRAYFTGNETQAMGQAGIGRDLSQGELKKNTFDNYPPALWFLD